ncbi:aminoglycoside phosphotransferase family protein [Vibrio makurazakiensis]|uniref:phosphotransferase enzyme family protein n=1 Tax=Vibrio makurazakiensis TaxID=2910250 RepID=UPI003D0B3395
MKELEGGRENAIFLVEDKVFRPSGRWSVAVHKLLSYVDKVGFDAAPKSYSFDQCGNEVLSYVQGDVFNYPLKGNIATKEALESAARLLRQYHDASSSFVSKLAHENMEWMLPTREPIEVICHGDYAPYNVALNGTQTVGVFDFDTAHPAPRIWDIAYAVYCWAPFKTHRSDALGDLKSQSIRARQFCDAYGLCSLSRESLVENMIARIQCLVDHMHSEANNGNKAFIENIKGGHHLAYLADIEYLRLNTNYITNSLVN